MIAKGVQFGAPSPVSFPGSISLSIQCEKQETVEWCWDSMICAFAAYLKLSRVPDEPDLANLRTGRSDCSLSPTPQECIVPSTPEQIEAVLNHLGMGCVALAEPLQEVNLRNELIAARPVGMGILWNTGGGHVAVIRGYDPASGMYSITDPYFGDGKAPYALLLDGYGKGKWFETFGRFEVRSPSYQSLDPSSGKPLINFTV